MQFRSGGELLQDDQVYLAVSRPTDQLVVPVQDKVVIRPAFRSLFEDVLGRAFFCYQLLTASVFSVIGK